ncbi:MAG: dehydratase [Actinomycetia bacterium]|nr:dehydratase [Actinomycetes bacterium]
MTARIAASEVTVGQVLPALDVPIQRMNLIMYAGASGDFNPIHWNERIATAVGLPNVIAHGMLTMAEAIRVVTDWVVDPAAVRAYQVRFSKPVVVPDDDAGALLHLAGEITEVAPDGLATVALTASVVSQGTDSSEVLQHAVAKVQLAG